ncbi:MAG: FAD-dependent thymidylate synthase [Candidatus Bathyarchaeota archaeon]|nr:MAG: FAD-dependent thymidylate synthase [Candidatus Bathyarchaeota archaeon]
MDVELKEYTRNGIQLIAEAVRVTGPFFNKIPNDIIVRKMVKHDYGSALEHVYFTFELKDISVALSRELLEHRMASHTAKSTRYVSQAKGLPFYMPPQIDGALREKVKNHIEATWELYKQLEKDIDRESARYVLPMGLKCTYVWTINCRSLLNFLRLRLCLNAAPEMQELARKVKAIVIKQYPEIFENVDCRGQQWGVCPEPYKRSCHKYPTTKKLKAAEEENC